MPLPAAPLRVPHTMMVLGIVLLDVASYQVIIPMMPAMGAHFAITSHWQLGWALSIFPLAVLFGGPMMGALSDRWGRSPVLIGCVGGQAISYLGMIAACIQGSWALLLGSRALCGLCAQSNVPVIQALFLDASQDNPGLRRRYLTAVGVALSLGVGVGPVISSLLTAHPDVPLWVPFGVMCGMSVALGIGLMAIARYLPPPSSRSADGSPIRTWSAMGQAIRPVWPLLGAFWLFELGWTLYYLTVPVHLRTALSASLPTIGMWSASVGVTMGVTLLVYPLWSERIPVTVQAMVALGTAIGVVISSGWAVSTSAWLISGGCMAVLIPIAYMAIISRLSHAAPAAYYGWIMGLAQGGISTAWTISGLVATVLYNHHMYVPFGMSVGFFAHAIFLWKVYHNRYALV